MKVTPLPLADAQRRLGKPGRPKKTATEALSPPSANVCTPVLTSRLLDLETSGAYLGVSAWTVRDLLANGTLRRVRVPLPNGGELRRVLVDRQDLDRLIETWKEPA